MNVFSKHTGVNKMGNSDSHQFIPVWDPEHKILDLDRIVNHQEFCNHIKGSSFDNTLTELPNSLLEEISLYETLLARFQSFTDIPSVLPLHLPHLSYLDLSYNKLVKLPDSFGLFFHLRVVLLNNNRLEHLPPSFTSLLKLEKVDLSVNKLLSLPKDFGNLKQLKKLNLNQNLLTYLPKSLSKCLQLKLILARDNFCQNPPQEICDEGSGRLLMFIRENFSQDSEQKHPNEENLFHRVRSNQIYSPNIESAHVKYMQIQTETSNVPSPVKTPLLMPCNSSVFSFDELKDKIIGGLIYGAFIGDALGVATDFLSPDECQFYYEADLLTYSDIIADKHRSHWKKGVWTSNGDLMLIMLDSIIQWAGVVDELDFAQKLLAWKHRNDTNDDLPAYTTSATINDVTELPDYSSNPHAAVEQLLVYDKPLLNGHDGTSNKPITKYLDYASLPCAIILGILHFHNLHEVVLNSIRICRSLHAHPKCIAANVSISCLVALTLTHLQQGKYDLNCTSDRNAMINAAKSIALEYLPQSNKDEEFHMCFQHQTLDRQTLTHILMQGGHATINGCAAGAFLGSLSGFKKLPRELIEELNPGSKQLLNFRINTLLDMMAIP
uniref:Uncharacterized protein n=1 Tax=Strigamia maritima TaxID=126957 RepID=T1IWB6_STRMM